MISLLLDSYSLIGLSFNGSQLQLVEAIGLASDERDPTPVTTCETARREIGFSGAKSVATALSITLSWRTIACAIYTWASTIGQ